MPIHIKGDHVYFQTKGDHVHFKYEDVFQERPAMNIQQKAVIALAAKKDEPGKYDQFMIEMQERTGMSYDSIEARVLLISLGMPA